MTASTDHVITGKDVLPDPVSGPIDALKEFYLAFNGRDMALMSRDWARADDIAMSNPLGGIKRGWQEISSVYRNIFAAGIRVYVEFYDFRIIESGDMFCAVGRERGHINKGDTELALEIRTSRVYERLNSRWFQVHHHGSIDDPGLLKAYQDMVLRGKE